MNDIGPTEAAGLSHDEAARRLAAFGSNAMPDDRAALLTRFARHFWAPVPWMLEAVIFLQLVLGEHVAAVMITVLLLINASLGFVQESRADATLALLKQRLALKVRLRRDGHWIDAVATELVPGDVVQLALGTIIPADIRILSGSVSADHSMLTGESRFVELGPGMQGYAGAPVRRGEAVAEVTATGSKTYFGRTAELVRLAHVESSEQRAVMNVVRSLTVANFAIVVALVAYAQYRGLTLQETIPLVLTALLAAVPVALPATFTLAAVVAAQTLARKGVLLTRLSALQEAAEIDVLCADKTGTLTENTLRVVAVRSTCPGYSEADVLRLAAAASSTGGQDAVDAAIRMAAGNTPDGLVVSDFIPFDPAKKMAQASVISGNGRVSSVVKGSPIAIARVAANTPSASSAERELTEAGYRALAVAMGPAEAMVIIGLIGLSDPPRSDSAPLLATLRSLGVHTVMMTGDTAETASTVARAIGLEGAVCRREDMPARVRPEDYAIFAGVYPEDKFKLVRAFQRDGHVVGMFGDGANDAPALRQAHMGIAVSTATDVAKSAAGIVLTEPGLGGIVTSIQEGRAAFQRLLTYTLSLLVNKSVTMLVMTAGLILTGHAVLTPLLQGIWLVAGDLVTMARAADRAEPTPYPNAWRVRELALAAIPLGICKLSFCVAAIILAWVLLDFKPAQMQTLTFLMLILFGQATTYVMRVRGRFWRSHPAKVMLAASAANVAFVTALAWSGTFMAALPGTVVIGLFVASGFMAFALDQVKVVVLSRLAVDRADSKADGLTLINAKI